MSETIEAMIHQLPKIAPILMQRSSITFYRSKAGNLLSIYSNTDAAIDLSFYLELIPIANLIQESFGISQIWLCDRQRDRVLHWSTQEILEIAEAWKI